MNNNIHSIQTQRLASVNIKSTVNGGSSVFVRVLENKGSSSYLVSFAGQKILVKSERSLVPGQTFRADVKILADRIIVLVPQTEEQNIKSILDSVSLIDKDGNPQGLLQSFLSSQNLAGDSISLTIFQFLQQSGFKTDKTLMDKARRIALNFTGKEKKAAEVAVLLMEEGIEASPSLVQKIMELLEGKQSENEKNDRRAEEKNEELENGENILKKIYVHSSPKADLLSFVNQKVEHNPHWIFFPYEWNFCDTQAHGLISFLIDFKTKETQKMSLNCKFNSKEYYFVLYYKNGFPCRIEFSHKGQNIGSSLDCENFLRKILSQEEELKDIQVEYCDRAYAEGFLTQNKIVPLVLGETLA